MARDITDTHPHLYRALMGAGWQFSPLRGGGGMFRHDLVGLTVHAKSTGAVDVRRRSDSANAMPCATFDRDFAPIAVAAAVLACTDVDARQAVTA